MTAGRVFRRRRTGILQIRFELDRLSGFLQLTLRDLLHFLAPFGRDEIRHDDKALLAQRVNLLFLRME